MRTARTGINPRKLRRIRRLTLAQVTQFVSRLAKNEHTRSGVLLFAIIVAGSILQFAMFSLAARRLGPDDFGTFATWFNITSLLAVAGALGQEKLISRVWHEYAGDGNMDRATRALALSTAASLAGAISVASVLAVVAYQSGVPPALVGAAALIVVAQAMLSLTFHAARPIAGVVVATGVFELVWRVLVVAILVAALVTGMAQDSPLLTAEIAGAMLIAMALNMYLSGRRLPTLVNLATASRSNIAGWHRHSLRMWGSAVVEAGGQFGDVIVIGLLFKPAAAGAYFAASRVANSLYRLTVGTAHQAASKVSLLFYHRPRSEFTGFVRNLAIQTSVVVILGFLGLVVLGKPLLGLFGASFVEEYRTMLVLGSGASIAALFSLAPYLLLQTGFEGLYLQTITTSLVGRLSLVAVLVVVMGGLGAAIAVSTASVATALVLNFYCRKYVGVDASIFGLVWPVKGELKHAEI